FATAFISQESFAANIAKLADPAQGNCQILTDDVLYYEEPMFQDGVISQAISAAHNVHDVAYFSAAGNCGNQGYEAVAPAGGQLSFSNGYLDFDPGPGVDTTLRVTIAQYQSIHMVLQWDDPFYTVGGVGTDLDLELVNVIDGSVVSSSRPNMTM